MILQLSCKGDPAEIIIQPMHPEMHLAFSARYAHSHIDNSHFKMHILYEFLVPHTVLPHYHK